MSRGGGWKRWGKELATRKNQTLSSLATTTQTHSTLTARVRFGQHGVQAGRDGGDVGVQVARQEGGLGGGGGAVGRGGGGGVLWVCC